MPDLIAARLLREDWKTPKALAQELYVLLSGRGGETPAAASTAAATVDALPARNRVLFPQAAARRATAAARPRLTTNDTTRTSRTNGPPPYRRGANGERLVPGGHRDPVSPAPQGGDLAGRRREAGRPPAPGAAVMPSARPAAAPRPRPVPAPPRLPAAQPDRPPTVPTPRALTPESRVGPPTLDPPARRPPPLPAPPQSAIIPRAPLASGALSPGEAGGLELDLATTIRPAFAAPEAPAVPAPVGFDSPPPATKKAGEAYQDDFRLKSDDFTHIPWGALGAARIGITGAGGIPAASGISSSSTAGQGPVNFVNIDENGKYSPDIADVAFNVDNVNAVAGNRLVVVADVQGQWVVIVDLCGA